MEEPIQGVSVVIWTKTREGSYALLLGKESKYLAEDFSDEIFTDNNGDTHNIRNYILRMSIVRQTTDIDDAKQQFRELATNIRNDIFRKEIEVRFDTPEQIGEDVFKTNYRYLNPSTFKRGITKGGIKPGEQPIHAAIREVGEEIGIKLSEHALVQIGQCKGNIVFCCEISNRDVEPVIVKRLRERQQSKYGELFEATFKTRDHVFELIGESKLNRKSKCAIEIFDAWFRENRRTGGKTRNYKKTRKYKRTRVRKHKKTKNTRKYPIKKR